MNRNKHTTKGKCRCQRCEAIAAGKTSAQADADYRKWEHDNLQKHGWIVHFVSNDDPGSPTGFNAHTHGLKVNYDHADFQIVVPLPEKVLHAIMITLADRVKDGEKFQAEQKVEGVIVGLPVKMVDANECGRQVLRVILPDPKGKLDLGEIDKAYARQYADLEGVREP